MTNVWSSISIIVLINLWYLMKNSDKQYLNHSKESISVLIFYTDSDNWCHTFDLNNNQI